MKNLAIIPARGGSKRIPRKNIKEFLGKPIIAYSIETAISSGLFDEVMVSTDDIEIAEIAVKYGANVPFMRSSETANDHATTEDVLKEVEQKYAEKNKVFDYICCIYPCTPLLTKELLKNSFEVFIHEAYNLLYPIIAYSHPIQRALTINEEKKISYFYPENQANRTQDLVTCYHDAGQFYWMTVKYLYKKHNEEKNIGAVIISELEAQDIDNDNDWKMAELKFKHKRLTK